MIKAVIFDMDGVIADTEPLHEQARNMILRKYDLDVERLSPEAIGRSKRVFWKDITERFHLGVSEDVLTKYEFELLLQIAKETKLRPMRGITELLDYLKEHKIKIAVASSSDRNYVEQILQITELSDKFSVISCGNEVAKAKPSPDVYLDALAKLKLNGNDVFAVEDSDTGAAAACAAGIECIGYDAEEVGVRQSLSRCFTVVNDMTKIIGVVAANA